MGYVKTKDLIGQRVQLLCDVTTNGGFRFLGGDTFVVTGLIRSEGPYRGHRLELQREEDGKRLVVWRKRVRLLVPWPPVENPVVDCVRIARGQRFDVCSTCGKRGVYKCAPLGVERCRYCGDRP